MARSEANVDQFEEFTLEFRTLAAGAGWNNRALIDHYRCSLLI